ncbi:DUF6994 family protein [Streptococcus marimammalium]|uniref:DUF6994 family protein n=1 Tax=Streptococcus marimammalium TaxID=269666 RepID=UPI00035CC46C|nr:hypothetical protein [Streptococcus marimammalium]
MYIYVENIKRYENFYKSDFYNYLKKENEPFIYDILEALTLDADAFDEELYLELSNKINIKVAVRKKCLIDDNGIRLSSDVICGRKQFYKLYNGDPTKWIPAYEKIRSNVNFHFLWPQHKAPTINTLRYAKFKDRIDYTLFDLKNYFENKECKLYKAFTSPNTKKWLESFNDFTDLVDKMNLNHFVDENYNVYDISTLNKEIIKEYIDINEINRTLNKYLENLLYLELITQ